MFGRMCGACSQRRSQGVCWPLRANPTKRPSIAEQRCALRRPAPSGRNPAIRRADSGDAGMRSIIASQHPCGHGRICAIARAGIYARPVAESGQKNAQPRRVALSFHQRRRFGGHAPTPVEDAQRKVIIAQTGARRKRFLLLCNISQLHCNMRASCKTNI